MPGMGYGVRGDPALGDSLIPVVTERARTRVGVFQCVHYLVTGYSFFRCPSEGRPDSVELCSVRRLSGPNFNQWAPPVFLSSSARCSDGALGRGRDPGGARREIRAQVLEIAITRVFRRYARSSQACKRNRAPS